jgi:hypothetical protein
MRSHTPAIAALRPISRRPALPVSEPRRPEGITSRQSSVRQIVYVTQSPAAAPSADAQIQFAGGTATIEWPPFREAA